MLYPVLNELGTAFQYPHNSPHLRRARASPGMPRSLGLHLSGGNTLCISPALVAAAWHTRERAQQPTFLLSHWSNLPRTFLPRSQNKANGLFIPPQGRAGPCAGRECLVSSQSLVSEAQ